MLPAGNRLRRRQEFATAVRRGVRAGRPTLVAHVHKLSDPEGGDRVPARVGFVVGRTVGPAVVRNRVRRRLRHVARARVDQLPANALVVVRALPAAAAASFSELAADLDAALMRALRGPR